MMRIILDECLTRLLKRELPGHDVSTVRENGRAGKKNGELLKILESACDVFITIDGNMTYQQNLSSVRIALIVLSARSNGIRHLKPLAPKIHNALNTIKPGDVVSVGE
jgi:hypothetical protein